MRSPGRRCWCMAISTRRPRSTFPIILFSPRCIRSAAFTPLHLTTYQRHQNYQRLTTSHAEAIPHARDRAPIMERAVYGASPFVHPARPMFREFSELRMLKRAEARAPIRSRAATASVRIRRDDGCCTTANHACFLPGMLSRDSVRCTGWRASNARRHG